MSFWERCGNLYKAFIWETRFDSYRFNLIQYLVFKLSSDQTEFTNSIDTCKLFWQFAATLKIDPLFITAIAHPFYTQHRYPVLDLKLLTPCFGRVSFKIVAGIKIYAHLGWHRWCCCDMHVNFSTLHRFSNRELPQFTSQFTNCSSQLRSNCSVTVKIDSARYFYILI